MYQNVRTPVNHKITLFSTVGKCYTFNAMKILVLLPLLLLAWYLIDRIGLWLHKSNAGELPKQRDGLDRSLQDLKYALSAVGRIQSALNACTGNGTIQGLGDVLKEYIHETMMRGEDSNVAKLIMGINHSSDDVMLATAIGDEFRKRTLTLDLVAEMTRRQKTASSDYAKCAWALSITLCKLPDSSEYV